MKLSNLLRAPEGVHVTITPPEAPSTAPNGQTTIDYFMESLSEPGMVQMLHVVATDNHDGNGADSTIGMYDIESFKFTEIGKSGMLEITGQHAQVEQDYDVTLKNAAGTEHF